jgi:hypothetical protein
MVRERCPTVTAGDERDGNTGPIPLRARADPPKRSRSARSPSLLDAEGAAGPVTTWSISLSKVLGGTVPLKEALEMRTDTQVITIGAQPKDVLSFVGDGHNLPRWAIGFAKSVRPCEPGWIVTTGQGEVPTFIVVDEHAGTVDFRLEPAPGVEATAYARVVPKGDGAEFVFTQMQQPGVSDEVFDQLVAAVSHELAALKAILEVECPL